MTSTPEQCGALSSSIMNYYKRFGQNRDLEKFLLFRRNYNKSSSEGSLSHTFQSKTDVNKEYDENICQSLQNLSIIKNVCDETSEDKEKNYTQNEFLDNSKNKILMSEEKLITSKENISKTKKGMNINFESFIEINMPQNNPTTSTPYSFTDQQQKSDRIASREKTIETLNDKEIEMPIVPATNKVTPNQSFQQHHEVEQNCSPTSSIASQHKQKLEWDSGADVGYSKKNDEDIGNGLTSLERNALTKLFANFGVNIELLSSNKKQNIEENQENKTADDKPLQTTNKIEVRRKWKNIYEKILQQSYEKEKQRIDIGQSLQLKSQNEAQHSNLIAEQFSRLEKFCQTSHKELKSLGIQVSQSDDFLKSKITLDNLSRNSSQSSKTSNIRSPSIDNTSLGKYENEGKSKSENSTDTDSFKFVLGHEYQEQTNLNKIDSIPKSIESSNLSESKLGNDPCFQKLSKLEKKLTLGINLMNALLQSKSLSVDSKNILITKIITKLEKHIKNNCNNGSTGLFEFCKNNILESIPQHLDKTKNIEASQEKTNRKKIDSPISGINTIKSKKSGISQSSAKSNPSSAKSEWLQPMTHSEIDYEKSRKSDEIGRQTSNSDNENKIQISLIEANIKYLEKLKLFLKNGGQGKNLKINTSPVPNSSPSLQNPTKSESKSSVSWNSHCNLKENYSKKNIHRSKLETPKPTLNDSNESINTFAKYKKEEFAEKYNRMLQKSNQNLKAIQVIYTKPYSCTGDYYSNSSQAIINKAQFNQLKNKNIRPPTSSTTASSSNMFVSLNNDSTSISLPATSSKGTSSSLKFENQHQNQHSNLNIGTQTTDSLRRTVPIFLSHKHTRSTHTKRVKDMKIDKSNQITPRSLGYTITFSGDRITNLNKISEQNIILEDYYDKANEDNLDKETQNDKKVGDSSSNFNSSYIDFANYVSSLQSYLNEKRPKFLENAEKRRRYIHDINERRKFRNEERIKILNTNLSQSINTKLKNLPVTISPSKKLFSSQQLKLQTKRKYSTLPEVIKQKQMVKENQLKKNNKRVMDIFNRNLQKQALKGKVSLSHSLVLV